MEKWDLYDGDRQPLNRIHNRSDEMKIGEYHIVVDVWTINSNKEVLVTLRHPNKDIYPNLWENTGGSIICGETSIVGAIRELHEETGILAEARELNLLGTKKEITAFVDTYILRKDIDREDLVMQENETVDAKWVSVEELDRMMECGDIAAPVVERLKPLRKAFDTFMGL